MTLGIKDRPGMLDTSLPPIHGADALAPHPSLIAYPADTKTLTTLKISERPRQARRRTGAAGSCGTNRKHLPHARPRGNPPPPPAIHEYVRLPWSDLQEATSARSISSPFPLARESVPPSVETSRAQPHDPPITRIHLPALYSYLAPIS